LFWCPACVHMMQRPSSEKWHLLLAHDPSKMHVVLWIFVHGYLLPSTNWTNWSSLEACLQSVKWFKVRVDLNTFNHLKVIWSKPYETYVQLDIFCPSFKSNNQRSNEISVCAKIRTYDLLDHRLARYRISYAASLIIGCNCIIINLPKCNCN
jgi:hypothetical protein